jgi:hypothetical protein
MSKKKKVLKELAWFASALVGGFILCLIFYDMINVNFNATVMVSGIIVIVLAVYVVRLTLWVFKQSV